MSELSILRWCLDSRGLRFLMLNCTWDTASSSVMVPFSGIWKNGWVMSWFGDGVWSRYRLWSQGSGEEPWDRKYAPSG